MAWVEKQAVDKSAHALTNAMRMLLVGPLRPDKEYGTEGKIWSDSKFFNDMIRLNGAWSERQEALIVKTLEWYEKNGSKLAHLAEKPPQREVASTDIPF